MAETSTAIGRGAMAGGAKSGTDKLGTDKLGTDTDADADAETDTATGGICTPLFELHTALGGRMVSFAGHALPMRFEGTVAEHRRTRSAAGLFDVSHMGIVDLHPGTDDLRDDDLRDATAWLERCVPGSMQSLQPGQMRYTLFTTPSGGVLDDLIVAHHRSRLRLVVNAARIDADMAMLRAANGGSDDGEVRICLRHDLALLALQGPAAADVVARWAPAAAQLAFMATAAMSINGVECEVSRCGYTGEDGFELAVPAADAVHVAELLLGCEEVSPAGLGARDTLRLEAGLPLVGHELTESTSPAEAGLGWCIPKRRRAQGGFPGADAIAAQLARGPSRRRVGIVADGRRPIRDGAVLADAQGSEVGIVTSGSYGPTVDAPIAMGYVAVEHGTVGTELFARGRKGPEPCRVVPLPFVEHRYWRPS
ncbi:glycine cleavage system aminomethyltransferase GcvT [Candidatus Poriferisodalis sp.]|uniref:glycine cleavage system aminomethyltransferase GcvT n=1 Tax=Candidatus Poriferisodalis sp. TaxID=3101277 RepID=UPI003B01C2B2